ncbi:MAG: SDR family NAD(P)-dependent oxidoreductase [Clostridia bacterium]|nr:SDR family NAD(P)-dependent oxidoreductase [Clostridia bacterium]
MKYKKDWLNGKTIVISGASSGIGAQVSKLLVKKYNCKVIGIARNENKMQNFVKDLGESAKNFSYYLFDVSDEQSWEQFAINLKNDKIQIDVLINNAGFLPAFNKATMQDVEQTKNSMQTNFYSSIYAYKQLYSNLTNSTSPCIVNICSSDALCPLVGTSLYASSKGAMKNYFEAMQIEENQNMHIGLIYPGFVKTDIFKNQTNEKDKIVDKFSMNAEKAAKKIVKAIKKCKKRKVIGFDALFMDFMYRHFPKFSLRFFAYILRKSKIKLYKDVF